MVQGGQINSANDGLHKSARSVQTSAANALWKPHLIRDNTVRFAFKFLLKSLPTDFLNNHHMNKMAPEKVQEIMKNHGQEISLHQANEVLKFMTMLASIAVKNYLAGKNK